MSASWTLACSECAERREHTPLATLCPRCQAPWLVEYPRSVGVEQKNHLPRDVWSMWRYRSWLPVTDDEQPVSLGEGGTPLVRADRLAQRIGVAALWVKDEALNPTGSFKARGLSAAVTRARFDGARRLTVPTAGNAGVALSAYASAAGLPVTVFAPQTTPPRVLEQIRMFGADLRLIDGHIGDCGVAARRHAAETGAFDVSTLREPYRIEGKKTMGLEVAEQLGWKLPDAIVYPTGGGTGLIGMWIAFRALRQGGWVRDPMPRLFSVQSTGCAPVVRAFREGARDTTAWERPVTRAAGLRVPHPLGGRLMLRAIADSRGAAVAVTDEEMEQAQQEMATLEGIDASLEGGATVAGTQRLLADGTLDSRSSVVLFNTGAGWLYRVL